MKLGLTLEQLGQELVCQSEVKQDYLVSSDKMRMETYGGLPILRVLDSAGGDCMEPLELNSTAHRQLGGYPEGHHLISGACCHTFSPPHKKLVCCRSPSGNDNIPKIFVDSHTKRPELRESYQLQESRSALILFSAVQALRCGSEA